MLPVMERPGVSDAESSQMIYFRYVNSPRQKTTQDPLQAQPIPVSHGANAEQYVPGRVSDQPKVPTCAQ